MIQLNHLTEMEYFDDQWKYYEINQLRQLLKFREYEIKELKKQITELCALVDSMGLEDNDDGYSRRWDLYTDQ